MLSSHFRKDMFVMVKVDVVFIWTDFQLESAVDGVRSESIVKI